MDSTPKLPGARRSRMKRRRRSVQRSAKKGVPAKEMPKLSADGKKLICWKVKDKKDRIRSGSTDRSSAASVFSPSPGSLQVSSANTSGPASGAISSLQRAVQQHKGSWPTRIMSSSSVETPFNLTSPPRLTPGKVMRRTLRMQPSPLSSPSFPSVGGSPTVQGSPVLAAHGIMNEVGSHPQQRTSTPYSVGRQLLAYDAANKALDRHKAIFNRRVDKIKGWQMAEETAAAARARAKRKGKPLHYDRKSQPEVGRFYHMEGDEVQPLMSPTSLAKSKAALRISRRVPLTPQRKQKRQKTPPRKAITPRTLAHEAATKARALRRTRKRKFVRVKKT